MEATIDTTATILSRTPNRDSPEARGLVRAIPIALPITTPRPGTRTPPPRSDLMFPSITKDKRTHFGSPALEAPTSPLSTTYE